MGAGVENAIIAPWAQYGAIGSAVIALGVVAVLQWRRINTVNDARLGEMRECAAQIRDLLVKKIESDNGLTKALEGLQRLIEQLKVRA